MRWGVETGEAGLGEGGKEVPCVMWLSQVSVSGACPVGSWERRFRVQARIHAEEKHTLILEQWWQPPVLLG